ncbi:hypothetical protein G9A89_021074 [Geosiphon pyriformis]|nr:hypothetical protein G9A89_021074 [Geosiphon pyriformis]
MVSFVCDTCQETLKKPKLDAHVARCVQAQFTCIDCSTTFLGGDYRFHTACVTEAEKYQKALYKGKKKKSKDYENQIKVNNFEGDGKSGNVNKKEKNGKMDGTIFLEKASPKINKKKNMEEKAENNSHQIEKEAKDKAGRDKNKRHSLDQTLFEKGSKIYENNPEKVSGVTISSQEQNSGYSEKQIDYNKIDAKEIQIKLLESGKDHKKEASKNLFSVAPNNSDQKKGSKKNKKKRDNKKAEKPENLVPNKPIETIVEPLNAKKSGSKKRSSDHHSSSFDTVPIDNISKESHKKQKKDLSRNVFTETKIAVIENSDNIDSHQKEVPKIHNGNMKRKAEAILETLSLSENSDSDVIEESSTTRVLKTKSFKTKKDGSDFESEDSIKRNEEKAVNKKTKLDFKDKKVESKVAQEELDFAIVVPAMIRESFVTAKTKELSFHRLEELVIQKIMNNERNKYSTEHLKKQFRKNAALVSDDGITVLLK